MEAPRTKEAPKESSPASHWCLNGFCQEAAPLLRVRVDRPGLADSTGGKASKVTIQVARSSVLPSLAVNLHNICQISLKFQQVDLSGLPFEDDLSDSLCLDVTNISTCKWIDPTVLFGVLWTGPRSILEEKIETLEAQKREVAEQLHKAPGGLDG